MIPIDKKITELTWGEIVADLDERYGKGKVVPKQQYLNPDMEPLLNVKQCAALTGYVEGYIRQLVFNHSGGNKKIEDGVTISKYRNVGININGIIDFIKSK